MLMVSYEAAQSTSLLSGHDINLSLQLLHSSKQKAVCSSHMRMTIQLLRDLKLI